jgi:hypothetical protein
MQSDGIHGSTVSLTAEVTCCLADSLAESCSGRELVPGRASLFEKGSFVVALELPFWSDEVGATTAL